MELFNRILGILTPVTVLGAGLFFSLILRGLPLTRARLCVGSLTRSGASSFRSLTLALAGTLGVGNIIGVSSAIALGGFGSIFWMWASALASMVLKYCEITLGVKYRVRKGGVLAGGPMYYMENGVGGKAGRALALLFSVACVASSFALGNIVQVNAALESAGYIFGWSKIAAGAAFAIITAAVILGGFTRISRFTSIVLPIISGVYIVLCLAVVLRGKHKRRCKIEA